MSIAGFWILLYYGLKKSVTLVPSSGVPVEPDPRGMLAATFSCNNMKRYRIDPPKHQKYPKDMDPETHTF